MASHTTPSPQALVYEIRHATPNYPPHINVSSPSVEEQYEMNLHRTYQCSQLNAFSLEDLRDSGCWDFNPQMADLGSIPIHEIYRPDRWDLRSTKPLGNGFPGNLDMTNILIQNAMDPVLRITSLILRKSASRSWMDALLFGDRNTIASELMKDGVPPHHRLYQAYTFHRRSPEELEAVKLDGFSSATGYIGDLASQVKIKIVTRDEVQWAPGVLAATNRRRRDDWVAGSRLEDESYTGARIRILADNILPLLGSLTDSERWAQQLLLAVVLAHETMHALDGYVRSFKDPDIPDFASSPFFEDETVNEIGRSWENSVFDGVTRATIGYNNVNNPYRYLGILIETPWPNWNEYGTGAWSASSPFRFRDRDQIPVPDTFTLWPVHESFIQNCHQSQWWENEVEKFGFDACRPPRILGTQATRNPTNNSTTAGISVLGPAYDQFAFQSGMMRSNIKPTHDASASELQSWYITQQLSIYSNIITLAAKRKKLRRDHNLAIMDRNERQGHLDFLAHARNIYDPTDEWFSRDIATLLKQSPFPEVSIQARLLISEYEQTLRADKRRTYALEARDEARLQLAACVEVDDRAFWEGVVRDAEVRCRVFWDESGQDQNQDQGADIGNGGNTREAGDGGEAGGGIFDFLGIDFAEFG